MALGVSIVTVLFTLLPLAFVALVVGVLVHLRRQKERELREARRWAVARGWNFSQINPALDRRWTVGPMGLGRNRTAYNVVSGTFDQLPVAVFRFRHTTGSGDSQSTSYFTCYTVSLPTRVPHLLARPEGAFVSGRDLQFELMQFNDLWRVTAPDPRYAHDLMHPRMMERLLQPDAFGVTIAFGGTDVLMITNGITSMDLFDSRLRLLSDIVGLVPRFVWSNLGAEPPQIRPVGPGVPHAEQQHRIAQLFAVEEQPRHD